MNKVDGAQIRIRRGKRTLKECSQASGVSVSTWSKAERGEQQPHNATLLKIANCLGCTVEDLLVPTVSTTLLRSPDSTGRMYKALQRWPQGPVRAAQEALILDYLDLERTFRVAESNMAEAGRLLAHLRDHMTSALEVGAPHSDSSSDSTSS